MKLVNPRLGLEVELSENQVLNITVESPVKIFRGCISYLQTGRRRRRRIHPFGY